MRVLYSAYPSSQPIADDARHVFTDFLISGGGLIKEKLSTTQTTSTKVLAAKEPKEAIIGHSLNM